MQTEPRVETEAYPTGVLLPGAAAGEVLDAPAVASDAERAGRDGRANAGGGLVL
jgi:hypothetical protein